MFPERYFANRMFAPRYWPKVGDTLTVTASLCFTLDNNRPEFTLPRAPDSTLEDNRTEFTLEK